MDPVSHEAKMKSSTELDNVIDAGDNIRNVPDGADGHFHPDAVNAFDYFDTIFKVGGDRYFKGRVNIKNVNNGRLFKDITEIKDVTERL